MHSGSWAMSWVPLGNRFNFWCSTVMRLHNYLWTLWNDLIVFTSKLCHNAPPNPNSPNFFEALSLGAPASLHGRLGRQRGQDIGENTLEISRRCQVSSTIYMCFDTCRCQNVEPLQNFVILQVRTLLRGAGWKSDRILRPERQEGQGIDILMLRHFDFSTFCYFVMPPNYTNKCKRLRCSLCIEVLLWPLRILLLSPNLIYLPMIWFWNECAN